eukprot:7583567-Lingulodinium_polyedra.AAC.1
MKFPGPLVVAEFFEPLRNGGLAIAQHRLNWRQQSGVGPNTAVCREHAVLCESLRLEIEVAQLDLTALAGAELRVRRW